MFGLRTRSISPTRFIGWLGRRFSRTAPRHTGAALRAAACRWQPALEELESRLVPTVYLSTYHDLANPTVGTKVAYVIDLEGSGNQVTIDHQGSYLQVTVPPGTQLSGDAYAASNGNTQYCWDASYGEIWVRDNGDGNTVAINGIVKPLDYLSTASWQYHDKVAVGNGTLQGIQANVTLESDFAPVSVDVYDQNDVTNQVATLGSSTQYEAIHSAYSYPPQAIWGQFGSIAGLTPPTVGIYYQTSLIDNLTLHLGSGTSTVDVLDTFVNTTVVDSTGSPVPITTLGTYALQPTSPPAPTPGPQPTSPPAPTPVTSNPSTVTPRVDNVGVFRASTGVWYLDEVQASYNPATTLQINNFGGNGDSAVTGDWLGNGQKYVGVFRASTGTWYLSTTNTNYSPANTIQIGNFGSAGDVPVVGRWGSNPNVDYVGVFRPSTHQWFLDEVQGSYNPATTIQINNFGSSGDTPVVGNWGNSSITDSRTYVGVFRPSTGQWFLDKIEGDYNPATTIQINNFGASGDKAMVGNWLGGAQDGHAYVGVFRPSTGTWYLSTNNTTYSPSNTLQIGNFGSSTDTPQVGDFLGTGLTEVGVFRPSTGTWYLSKANATYAPSNTIQIGNFGASGDQPVVGAWAIPEPELLQGQPGSDTAPGLTDAELSTVVCAAISRWEAAGLGSAGMAILDNLHISIGNLPTGWLGAYVSGSIVIDPTAEGDGWFVDPTSQPGSAATGQVDALTVVMHEMGHALGLPDESAGVMSESLAAGTRNLPTPADVAAAFAAGL
jgi:hypothetical protein